MAEQIYRLHYRGHLRENVSEAQLQEALDLCIANVHRAQAQGKVLTAALYRADRMLFLYYEAIGKPLKVVEPIVMAGEGLQSGSAKPNSAMACGVIEADCVSAGDNAEQIMESGEDVQTTCLYPDELLAALNPCLQVWPGQQDDRLWVHMYHIYCHNRPESVEQWKRATVPEMRRGRIAFLRDDKLFSYTYYHKAIVDEGLLVGDKYQSIALHENILFSYFEEPKTLVNVQNDTTHESKVIEEWIAEDPEAHFIHMPEGKGENFSFLPALFAVGVEDCVI